MSKDNAGPRVNWISSRSRVKISSLMDLHESKATFSPSGPATSRQTEKTPVEHAHDEVRLIACAFPTRSGLSDDVKALSPADSPARIGTRQEAEARDRPRAFARLFGFCANTRCKVRGFLRPRFTEKNIDRIYFRLNDEGRKITLKSVGKAAWTFITSDLKEKAENLLHFRKMLRGVLDYGRRHGKGFLKWAVVSWLLDDFIIPAALWMFKMKSAAAFCLFMHFEWITYPSYFLAVAVLHRTIKKRLRPAEYQGLVERVQKSLEDEKTFRGRYSVVRDLMRSGGPYVNALFCRDLAQEYESCAPSSLERLGLREQAAKYLGRSLRESGIQSEPNRYAVRLLRHRIDDRDPWVRKAAIGAFGKFGSKLPFGQALEAYHAIKAHLYRDGEPSAVVRGAAARAFTAFPSEQTIQDLTLVLQDESEYSWNRRYAAEALGVIFKKLSFHRDMPLPSGTSKALEILARNAVPDFQASADVRTAAVGALALFPSAVQKNRHAAAQAERILSVLCEALSDPDAIVRESALWGFARQHSGKNGRSRSEDFYRVLSEAIQAGDDNMAELAHRLYRFACKSSSIKFPAELQGTMERRAAGRVLPKEINFVAVDCLYDPGFGEKTLQLDSPKVQELAAAIKAQGHCVCYSRNFLYDRSQSEMAEDGSINIFSNFDTVRFNTAMNLLRKGKVTKIPRIDFLRGKVAAGSRTLVPSAKGHIYVLGSQSELEQLAKYAGVEDIRIRKVEEEALQLPEGEA